MYGQPLGVTLLLAPNGGAVAVLASSGLNQAPPQVVLDTLIVQSALKATGTTLGESILNAKAQISDPDVRRTYVLFGDPAMKLSNLLRTRQVDELLRCVRANSRFLTAPSARFGMATNF